VTHNRLIVDRRGGADRRAEPRRRSISGVPLERRSVVDRRHGAERRSTVDRRGRPARPGSTEGPGEHLRNALQLMNHLAASGGLGAEARNVLAAAIQRVIRTLNLLERRRG
jgi:hypothetical protein